MSECEKAASLLEFIIRTQTNSKAIAIAGAVGYTVRPLAVVRLSWLLICLFTGDASGGAPPLLDDAGWRDLQGRLGSQPLPIFPPLGGLVS